jgi:hypothetical protein
MVLFTPSPHPQRVLTFRMGVYHPIITVELIFIAADLVLSLYHETQQTPNECKEKEKLPSLRKDVRLACLRICFHSKH